MRGSGKYIKTIIINSILIFFGISTVFGQASAPFISSISPQQNTLIKPEDNIVITFSEPIDAASASNGVKVYGDLTGPIAGTITGGNTAIISFNPTNDFKPNEEITVSVLASVTSTIGLPMANSYTIQYRVLSVSGPETPNYFAQETASDVPGTYNNPGFVDAADIDKDGDMDMVVSNTVIDQVAWYENDGSFSFTEHILTNSADFSREVQVGDLDLDGDLDIIGVSEFDDILRWYENDGNQTFTVQSISTGIGGPEIEIVDLDGDGDMDVIGSGSGAILIENDGALSFTKSTIAADGQNIRSIEVVDMDKDGFLDLLTVSIFPTPQIAWHRNDGMLGFTENIIDSDPDQEIVYPADINGDGFMDVVASSTNGSYIRWFRNDGSNAFTKIDLNPVLPSPREISPNDLDGDGDIDLLIADLQIDYLGWLENDGAGNFTERFITSAVDQPERAAVVDLDGDGDLDFFIGSTQADKVGWIINTLAPAVEQEIAVHNGSDTSFPEVLNGQTSVIDLGSILQGSSSSYTMSIANIGGQDLTISDVVTSGAPFSITGYSPTIVADSYSTLFIEIDGSTVGDFSGTITILSNDTDEATFTFPVTASVIAKPEFIYWTDNGLNQINRSDLDGSGFQQLYFEPDRVQAGVDYDTLNKQLFWSTESGLILRGDPSPTGIDNIVTLIDEFSSGAQYSGISVDPLNLMLYFVDNATLSIKSADLNEPDPNVSIKTLVPGMTVPRAVDVDADNGKIYFIDHELVTADPIVLEAVLYEADASDGSNKIEIFRSNNPGVSTYFYDLKVDRNSGKLYWVGGDANVIGYFYSAELSDISGTAVVTSDDSVLPIALDIDQKNNTLYWISVDQIYRSEPQGVNPQILHNGSPNLLAPAFLALDVTGIPSTPCTDPPFAQTGVSANLCGGDVIVLSGVIGGSANSATWTTNGDGSFDNPTLLDATYTAGPGDISDGSVTLTLTTNDPDGFGSCIPGRDDFLLTIVELPTVTLPADFSMCSTDVASLTSTISGTASTLLWSTSGDGSFDDVNITNPVYTPGANDIGSGSVTLTLDVDAGGCIVQETIVITIEQAHTVEVGLDQSICIGDIVSVSGTLGGSAASATWASSGDGSFANASSLSTTYTPGSMDVMNGTVSLVLSSSPGVCEPTSDTLVVSIGQPITASDQSAIANIGTPVLIDLSANGVFANGDVLTATITSPVTKGTLEIVSGTTVQYDANQGTVGEDGFTFTLCNQCNLCSDAVGTIEIANVPPEIAVQAVESNPGAVVTINVLGLVSDLNDNVDPNSLRVVSQPISGATASFDSDGNLIIDYTGVTFIGTDVLSIEVCDLDGLCVTQEIQIEVTEPTVVFYNAVSPNNDGKHDFLEIENADFYPNNRLVIMNRWGDVVFEISGYDNQSKIFAGEGNVGGAKDLPAGTYYYSLNLGDDSPPITGYFSLRK